MSELVTLQDICDAAERIRPFVRTTPIMPATANLTPVVADGLCLSLKLETLQATGAFKARGAMSKLLSLDTDQIARGLVTASGGNHGAAVAYAARCVGTRAVVFLSRHIPEDKAARIRSFGADVRRHGDVWDEANAAALRAVEDEGLSYVHPFADPKVIAGQGTIGLEIARQVPDVSTVIVAIGGGGLSAGVATALKALKPGVRIVGVEPTGAPTLFESMRAGQPVTLERITTGAGTLAPRRSTSLNLQILQDTLDRIVLVTDEEMRAACRWLWQEFSIGTEMAGAAAIAALMTERVTPSATGTCVPVICGSGLDWLP